MNFIEPEKRKVLVCLLCIQFFFFLGKMQSDSVGVCLSHCQMQSRNELS